MSSAQQLLQDAADSFKGIVAVSLRSIVIFMTEFSWSKSVLLMFILK